MLVTLKDAFATAFKKPLTWVALVAVPALVLCFALLYYDTFIDPFARMEELPVAVINQDAGTTFDGEERNFGQELENSLLDNNKAGWTAESPSLLDQGLENSDYFLAVVIPSDFSERVAAGETREPEQAQIQFFKNERKNAMLTTISSSMENELKTIVSQNVTEQYVRAFVQGLEDAQGGFSDAAEGAGSLQDGIEQAADGSAQLADGAGALADGSAQLEDGSTSVADGATSLKGGLDALDEGAQSLDAGAASVSSGAATLADGLDDLVAGTDSLSAGSQTFASALASKKDDLVGKVGGNPSDATAAAQAQYASALRDYTAAVARATAQGADPTNVDPSAVNSAVAQVAQASAASGAYSALDEVENAFAPLDDGIKQVADGAASAQSGAKAVSDGANQLATGAGTLASGTAQAQSGASALADGATQVADGQASATKGADELQEGAGSLAEGLGSAQDGAGDLTSALADGAQTIDGSLTASADDLASYTADPVAVQDDVYGDLGKFGYGFAPLFMSLSLWLGSLLIFFIFDPFPSRAKIGTNRLLAIFARWPLYLVLSVLNGLVVFIGAQATGLPITDTGMFALLLAVIAFSFMCIMQFFNLFDIPGKAVCVLLVIVQLVFCSGTFPAALGSDAAASAGPWLPFYYAIDAFREIMSGGVAQTAFHDMGVLLIFAAIATACSLLAYPAALKMKARRDRLALEELTGAPPLPTAESSAAGPMGAS